MFQKMLRSKQQLTSEECIEILPIPVSRCEMPVLRLWKSRANLVPVKYTDGAYYNFPESQKIIDGVYFIKAKGHTNGNSIVIVENDG